MIIRALNIHYRVHISLQLDPVLNQTNVLVKSVMPYFVKKNYIIIHPTMQVYQLSFPDQKCERITHFISSCRMPVSSHYWSNHPNNINI
jgi:phage-related holin